VKTVAVVVVALVVLGAAPAWASHTDVTDPNDVDGRLDLKQVLLDHDATRSSGLPDAAGGRQDTGPRAPAVEPTRAATRRSTVVLIR
jgi:hypothetical protein